MFDVTIMWLISFSKSEPHGTMAAFVAGRKGFKVKKKEKKPPDGIDIAASAIAPNIKFIIIIMSSWYPISFIT